METQLDKKLNEINKVFYRTNASSFSRTRRTAWQGWYRLINFLKNREFTNVLDIGCGNGRFSEFLTSQEIKFGRYLGIDFSRELIKKARDVYSDRKTVVFDQVDFMADGFSMASNVKYDLVVSFGVLHHIYGRENRLRQLEQMARLLELEGLLVVTFWQYMKSNRFDKLIFDKKSVAEILAEDTGKLEDGDNLLDWNLSGIPRYCHNFNDDEIDYYIKNLEKRGLKVIDDYNSDGKEGGLNRYVIWTMGKGQ